MISLGFLRGYEGVAQFPAVAGAEFHVIGNGVNSFNQTIRLISDEVTDLFFQLLGRIVSTDNPSVILRIFHLSTIRLKLQPPATQKSNRSKFLNIYPNVEIFRDLSILHGLKNCW